MKPAKIAALAIALAAGAALAAPAGAGTIAEFGIPPSATVTDNFFWNQTGSTSGTLTAIDAVGNPGAPVDFAFIGLTGLEQYIPATLTFTGTVTDTAATSGASLTQTGLSGSFKITPDASFVFNGKTYGTSTDLLSGTFTNAYITGPASSSTGNVQVSTTSTVSQGLTLASDILTFGPGQQGFSIDLTEIAQPLNATAGDSLDTFVASGRGGFEATLSSGGGAGGVPEPATWAMLMLGIAGIGATLRRRSYSFAPIA